MAGLLRFLSFLLLVLAVLGIPFGLAAPAAVSLVVSSMVLGFVARFVRRLERLGGGTAGAGAQRPPPLELSTEETDAVLAALQAGRKIEAIKLVRNFTGAGLADAKQYVDAMARTGRRAGAAQRMPAAAHPDLSPDLADAIRVIAQAGNKLEAIARVRELTGADLQTARRYVDELERS